MGTERSEDGTVSFNVELARDIAEGSDRNTARFFAGRERELESFRRACLDTRAERQTVFRTFTGAPGCGKTSLLHHIREIHGDVPELLFVPAGKSKLASMDRLAQHIVETALRAPNKGASFDAGRGAMLAAQGVAEYLRVRTFGDAVRDWLEERALDHVTVVMQIDETQNLGHRQLAVLAELHSDGLGMAKSVALLAGLSHTKTVLDSVGISRMARNADVEMGAMSADECTESTLAMLDALRVDGTEAERRAVAEKAGGLSRGWPQHLNRAQEALCKGLLAVHGALPQADMQAMERMIDAARAEHYESRLNHPAFGKDRELAQRIVVAVHGRTAQTDADLADICANEIAAMKRRRPKSHRPKATRVAKALIDKGVVAHTGRRFAVPVPSMVTWAEERLAQREQGSLPRH